MGIFKKREKYIFPLVVVILLLLIGIGSIGIFRRVTEAFTEETKTVNLYSTLCEGGWQNPQNAQGQPEVGPEGDFNSFSETNSAVYKGGALGLICEKFSPTLEELTNTQFQSAKIELSFAIGEKIIDLEIPQTEEATPEIIIPEEEEAPSEEAPSEEQQIEEPETILPSQELNEVGPQLEEPQLEEIIEQEEIEEEITEQLEADNQQEQQESVESTPPVEGEPTSFWNSPAQILFALREKLRWATQNFGEQAKFWAAKVKNFFGNLITKIVSIAKALVNKVALIVKAEENIAEEDIEDGTNLEELQNNTDSLEENQEELIQEELTNGEELATEDAKIVIWYSLDGENWQKLDTISSYPLSNALNGGYFNYDAPFLKSWEDVENLKIKFEGVVSGETNIVAFVDSIWVEATHIETKEIETEEVIEIEPIPEEESQELKIKKIDSTIYIIESLDGDIIEIGSKSHSPANPYLKLNKWQGESSLTVEVPFINQEEPVLSQNKLKWSSDKIDVVFYPVGPKEIEEKGHKFIQNELGGVEFDTILKEKPESNVFTFPIETEGLKFYYQPELTQEEIDEGTFRPENVVGSYAVYHESKQGDYTKLGGKNYKTGKALHIYRPKITDANGWEVWAELNIDERKGVLTVTIPQEFLDNAAYPVNVDPNFGYEEHGTFGGTILTDDIVGSWFTGPESGTAVSITADITDMVDTSDGIKFALYKLSDNSLVGKTEYFEGQHDDGWLTLNMIGSPSLSNIDYVLVAYGKGGCQIRMDEEVGKSREQWNIGDPETTEWPDPWSPSTTDYKYSIYSTYTPTSTDTWQVVASEDDGMCDESNFWTDSFYGFHLSYKAGARWSINIPSGSTIESAYLKLHGGSTDSETSTSEIRLFDQDSCDPFTGVFWDWAVTGLVTWEQTGWSGTEWYTSSDISTLVQSFIDREGYSTGNYLGLRSTYYSGTSVARNAETYDSLPSQAPKLEVTWTPPLTITVSGHAYDDEGSDPIDGSSTNKTVNLRVNGAGTDTDEITTSDGAWEITGVDAGSGDIITIYLDNETEEATTVYVSDGTAQTNVDLYKNRVIVRADTGSITNANLSTGDDSDDDIKYSVSGSDLTVDDGFELHVWDGDTFAPGGQITTSSASDQSSTDGDIHIDGTATLSAGGAISCGGDWNNEGTFTHNNHGVTFTGTTTGFTITDGGENFYDVTFNGSGGGWSFADAVTIDNDLTMTAGTLSGTNDITVNGGDAKCDGTCGTINLTSSSTFTLSGTGNFGTDGLASDWTFYNLTFGDGTSDITTSQGTGTITVSNVLTIGANQTLDAGSKTWTLSHSSTFTDTWQVGASKDDTYVSNDASNYCTTTYIYLGNFLSFYYDGGYRFTNVSIPQGATISSAYVELNEGYATEGCLTDLYGEDVDDAVDFDDANPLVPARDRTTATVPWDNPLASQGWDTSPDIKSIIQEIVNIAEWNSGNALAILQITDHESGYRPYAYSYDEDPTKAPKLEVTWTQSPFVINGTFTPNSSTLNYTGDGATTITGTTYYNLQAGNATTQTAARTYTLGGNTTVTNVLTVGPTSGSYTQTLDASSYTLTLSGSGTYTDTWQVGAGTDDADQRGGPGSTVYLDSTWIYLCVDGDYPNLVSGARFTNINIPQGSTIAAAKVIIEAATTKNGYCACRIHAEDVDSSVTFASDDGPADRTKTTAYVDWTVPAFTDGVSYNSPGLISVIQEVINRSGWSSGNPLSILFAENGSMSTYYRGAETYEGTGEAIKLEVTWVTGIPFVINSKGAFDDSSSTVKYTATADTNITATTYNNLELVPPGSQNFGYETIGSSYSDSQHRIQGSVFTITEDGTADSITWYGRTDFSVKKWKCAIYKHSDLSLIGETSEETSGYPGITWWTGTFSTPKPSLTQNTEYILVMWTEGGYPRLYYDDGVNSVQGHCDNEIYNNFPNPLVPTHEDRKYSIYLTYTPDPPTYTLGTAASQTINTNGYLTIGDGTNPVTVTAATYDPDLNIDGDLTISANAILNAGSGTWTLSNSGTPFSISGTFDAQTSTFKYTATADTNITTTTYNNLELSPPGSKTFGYETAGGSNAGIWDTVNGSWFTSPESGTADSITAYIQSSYPMSIHVKCAIYKKSDNSLVGSTEEKEFVDMFSARWETFNFPSPKPSLENIDYYLVIWGDYNIRVYYDEETNKGRSRYTTYDSWPDPITFSKNDSKYSIYLTYTPDPPTYTLGAGTTTTNGYLTIGDGTGAVTVSTTTNNPTVTVTTDLTVNTSATLSGSGTGTITVNGGDVTGDGTINLTGGTFTLDGASTTGFGGNTNWTFYNLTVGGDTNVETTTATGTGGITVSNVLTIGANQTLDAGSKTWTLSHSNTFTDTFYVGGSYDDAYERGDGVFDNSSTVYIVRTDTDPGSMTYHCSGLRFQSVSIPQGSTVTAAKVSGYAYLELYDDINSIIYGNDVDNALDFNDNQHIISESYRPRTSASVSWIEDGIAIGWAEKTGLQSIVGEIVGRSEWTSGNALVLLFIANIDPDTACYFKSYEEGSEYAAKLEVTWEAPVFVINGTFNAQTSTFNYTGDGDTTIIGTTYYNLQAGNATTQTAARTYTLGGNTTVTNVITVGPTSGNYTQTLDASSYALTLSGSSTPFVINSKGAFDDSSSTVKYTATADTNITATTYNNLEFVPPGSKTFGYETAGLDDLGFAGLIRGSWFTCPEAGTADSITVNIRHVSGTNAYKCAIYKKSDNSLVGSTEERTDIGSYDWYTFNFASPKPSLENIDYWLSVWSGASTARVHYDEETDKGAYDSETYDSWPDPWACTGPYDWKFSIYLTYTPDPPTYTLGTAASQTINTNGNLTIGNGINTSTITAATYDPNIDVNGNVTIANNATLTASDSATPYFKVAGNWSNSGAFNHSDGTVTFDGSTSQSIASGGSNFNNLTITNASTDGITFADNCTVETFTATTASTKLTFNAGSTYAFTNINLNGGATDTRIVMKSSEDNTAWLFNVTGTQQSVSFVDVKDSDASQGNTIDATDGTNLDSGNNTNWNFAIPTVPRIPGQGVVPIPPPVEPLIEIIKKISEEISEIAKKILEIVKPKPPPPPPPVPPVPEEAPMVFRGEWQLLPSKPIYEFVLSPLPRAIRTLVKKFPRLEEIFSQVGITKITDIRKLEGVKLTLPGLTERVGLIVPTGIPVAELSPGAKEKIPTDIVFCKTGGGKIDFDIALTIEKGKPQQKIRTISGKPLNCIVKPARPVEVIRGYIVFRAKKPTSSSFQFPLASLIDTLFFADPVFAFPQKEPVKIEEELVLIEFEYTDPDGDGIYTAEIQAPIVEGEYEIIIVMDYEDPALGMKEIRLITVVDPEGYIFEKYRGKELRIAGAIVSIYWLNPEIEEYELWPAEEFLQENPQTTNITGKYSFLVPSGSYYLQVEAPGYLTYQGESFQVKGGMGIHYNIELKTKYWWLRIVDWRIIALILIVIILLYKIYRDKIREKLMLRKIRKKYE